MRNRPADIPYGGLSAERIKAASPKFREKHLELFRQFVMERYRIHLKKDVHELAAPWTDDPILRDFKFTNVRREHDRTTRYLIKQLKKHADDSPVNIWCNILAFRLFNKIETYELLGGWVDFVDLDIAKVKRQLESAPPGFVYFTNAFYTTGMRQGMTRTSPTISLEPLRVIRAVYMNQEAVAFQINGARSPKDVCKAFELLDGVGSFLSYQMFVDLTYTPDFNWSENEFVVSGPGCVAGLDELFEDKGGLKHDELLFWLRDNCPFERDELFYLMYDLPEDDRVMNIMSLENCMCELSKYIRAVEGTGRPKNRYRKNK